MFYILHYHFYFTPEKQKKNHFETLDHTKDKHNILLCYIAIEIEMQTFFKYFEFLNHES